MEDNAKPLLQVKLPEMEDVEVYLIRLADGSIIARTKEELEKAPLRQGGKGA